MPELVASLCTLLVLAPLALMPGLGQFLFRPMALAVAFAMIVAYPAVADRSCPRAARAWLQSAPDLEGHPHGVDHGDRNAVEFSPPRSWLGRFATAGRRSSTGHRAATCAAWRRAPPPLGGDLRGPGPAGRRGPLLGSGLRREFFPEVDAGAFEIYVRAPSGTRIEVTEAKIAQVEQYIREKLGDDLELFISEIGVTRRLVGRLYAQRRADGRRGQSPIERRAAAVGPGIRPASSATDLPPIPASPTWNSPSMPAA